MTDEQDTDRAAENKNLKPEEKERLRAAIQILIDYLQTDSHLTQCSPVSQKMRKSLKCCTGDHLQVNTLTWGEISHIFIIEQTEFNANELLITERPCK